MPKDGGFLFPQDIFKNGEQMREGGATIRDFFAFAALMNGATPKEAYKDADLVLKEREKLNG